MMRKIGVPWAPCDRTRASRSYNCRRTLLVAVVISQCDSSSIGISLISLQDVKKFGIAWAACDRTRASRS